METKIREIEKDDVWVSIGDLMVHVFRTDEGVIADIWGKPKKGGPIESIASTYAYFDEVRPWPIPQGSRAENDNE